MKHGLLQAASAGIAACALSCAHQVQVGGNPPHAESVKMPKQVNEIRAFAGSINRIYKSVGIVTVVHWPLYRTFQIGPGCEIVIPGTDHATLDDFHLDDLVIVYYQKVGDVLVAERFARRSEEYIRERQEQLRRLEQMLYPSPGGWGSAD